MHTQRENGNVHTISSMEMPKIRVATKPSQGPSPWFSAGPLFHSTSREFLLSDMINFCSLLKNQFWGNVQRTSQIRTLCRHWGRHNYSYIKSKMNQRLEAKDRAQKIPVCLQMDQQVYLPFLHKCVLINSATRKISLYLSKLPPCELLINEKGQQQLMRMR